VLAFVPFFCRLYVAAQYFADRMAVDDMFNGTACGSSAG
jgi:hypothetical protein